MEYRYELDRLLVLLSSTEGTVVIWAIGYFCTSHVLKGSERKKGRLGHSWGRVRTLPENVRRRQILEPEEGLKSINMISKYPLVP